MASSRPTSPPDYLFLGALILILIFGFVMLASASSDVAQLRFDDSYYYLKRQIVNGLGLGFAVFFVGVFFFYRRFEKLALALLLFSIGLTLLVFTPFGFTAKGASRWIDLGFFAFQPSELLKATFPLYVASWLARNMDRGKRFVEGFLPLLAVMGGVALVLLLQPATTTTVIILSTALLVYFVAGARFRYFFLFGFLGVLGLALLIYMAPYRLERVRTFFHPEEVDALGAGYHIEQTKTAIGSGGLWGVGYGKSTTKIRYLPEPIGDSIFAVIAEELGFVGSSFLLFLYFVLIYRGVMIAKEVQDFFGKLLAAAFSAGVAIQVFVNVGAVSGVLPLTGVPLPYVSFGGTSLAVFLGMAGVIINVSRYRR